MLHLRPLKLMQDRALADDEITFAFESEIAEIKETHGMLGEKVAADHITYRVPDLKDPAVRTQCAGKRTAVIGSGASSFTALAYLADLAKC